MTRFNLVVMFNDIIMDIVFETILSSSHSPHLHEPNVINQSPSYHKYLQSFLLFTLFFMCDNDGGSHKITNIGAPILDVG
jgi:hypothetical protein